MSLCPASLQHCPLGIDNIQIVHRTLGVLHARQVRGVLRCLHRLVLSLGLRLQDANIGEAVLDLTKGDKNLLAIVRGILFINGACIGEVTLAPSPVENRNVLGSSRQGAEQEGPAAPFEEVA